MQALLEHHVQTNSDRLLLGKETQAATVTEMGLPSTWCLFHLFPDDSSTERIAAQVLARSRDAVPRCNDISVFGLFKSFGLQKLVNKAVLLCNDLIVAAHRKLLPARCHAKFPLRKASHF